MRLDVIRHQFGEDATNSLLFVDGVFECYGLEDEVRLDKKVMSETAIPQGEYEIKFRTVGGYHTREKARYDKKFGAGWHKGMLELQDVKNDKMSFKYVLIHSGNTDENTAGCYLVGQTQQDLDMSKDGFIGSSRLAYETFYPKVRDALLNGEKVTMKFSNINLKETKLSNSSPPEMVNPTTINEKLSEINGNLIDLNAKLEGKNIV
tara:strand:- start:187 stop:804 length:618 start_codon:yes stop_codon:yes gene_type:complete